MDQFLTVSPASEGRTGASAGDLPSTISRPAPGCSPGLAALFADWDRAWAVEIAAVSATDRARIAMASGRAPPAGFALLVATEEQAAAALARIDRAIALYPATTIGDLLAKLRFLDRLEPFSERAREGDWDAQILAGILADAERLHAG